MLVKPGTKAMPLQYVSLQNNSDMCLLKINVKILCSSLKLMATL